MKDELHGGISCKFLKLTPFYGESIIPINEIGYFMLDLVSIEHTVLEVTFK